MNTKDCLRYDAEQDRYWHFENGKPAKYDGLSKHLAGLIRDADKSKRQAKPFKANKGHVAGWTQWNKEHM